MTVLESGIGVDLWYTAAGAHIMIGRFVTNERFAEEGGAQEFLAEVKRLNSG